MILTSVGRRLQRAGGGLKLTSYVIILMSPSTLGVILPSVLCSMTNSTATLHYVNLLSIYSETCAQSFLTSQYSNHIYAQRNHKNHQYRLNIAHS